MFVCFSLIKFDVEVAVGGGVLDADEVDLLLSVDMWTPLEEVR